MCIASTDSIVPEPRYHDGGWDAPSRFVSRPGELHRVEDMDECPGRYDRLNPHHLKLKTQDLCGYCKMKRRIQMHQMANEEGD